MRDCVNLTLQNGPDVPRQSWIRFQVMDWDSMSSDDLIGKVASHVVLFFLSKSSPQASIKLSEATERAGEGEPTKLMLVSPSDAETHLSFAQTSAIYKLFAVLDPDNTGTIPEGTQNLVVDSAKKEAVLLNELKTFSCKFGQYMAQFGASLAMFPKLATRSRHLHCFIALDCPIGIIS